MGQLDEFSKGRIVGMASAGASASEIAKVVRKTDGNHPTNRAVELLGGLEARHGNRTKTIRKPERKLLVFIRNATKTVVSQRKNLNI